jgi:hypothetical protein
MSLSNNSSFSSFAFSLFLTRDFDLRSDSRLFFFRDLDLLLDADLSCLLDERRALRDLFLRCDRDRDRDRERRFFRRDRESQRDLFDLPFFFPLILSFLCDEPDLKMTKNIKILFFGSNKQ